MSGVSRTVHVFDAWILPLAGLLVPAAQRGDWFREWQAELWHLQHDDRRSHVRRNLHPRDELVASASLAYGVFVDAAWLRLDCLKSGLSGSAIGCLSELLLYCVICATLERLFVGSWRSYFGLMAAHFTGGFVFVAVPGLVAAMATNPLRPLRCNDLYDPSGERPKAELRSWFSSRFTVRVRWNLFLGAKVLLTLALGFLGVVAATAPLRLLPGSWADWVELILWMTVVTVSLRWALLNQGQRCQKCLRVLSQPTRVGPPSRNFLEWNGTEQSCADGHGRLRVPEMQGSWCWYDRWVERETAWHGLIGL